MANSFASSDMYQTVFNTLELLFFGPPAERAAFEADEEGYLRAHGVDPSQVSAQDMAQTADAVMSARTSSSAVDQDIDASVHLGGGGVLGGGSSGGGGPVYGQAAPEVIERIVRVPAEATPTEVVNHYSEYVTQNVTNVEQHHTFVDSSQNPTIVLGEDSHLDSLTLNNETYTASGEGAVAGSEIGQVNTGAGGVAAGAADNINTGERGIAAEEVAGVASGDGAAAVGGDAVAPIITGTVEGSTIVGGDMTDSTIGDHNVDADGASTVVQGAENMVAQGGATQTSVDGVANTVADRGSLVQDGAGNVAGSDLHNSAVAGRDALNASGNDDANLGFGQGAVTDQTVAEGGAAAVEGDATGSDDDTTIDHSADIAVAGEDALVDRFEDNDGLDLDDQDGLDIDDNDGHDLDLDLVDS